MAAAKTKTDLANLALSSLGELPLQNIEDNSTPARAIRAVLSETIRQVQELIDWQELITKVSPSLHEFDEESGEYHYNLPSNFLAIIDAPGGWYISNNKLVTGQEGAKITYRRFSEDVFAFSASMVELCYRKLAANVAMSLTQNQSIAGMAMQEYETVKSRALANTFNRQARSIRRGRQFGFLNSRNTGRRFY